MISRAEILSPSKMRASGSMTMGVMAMMAVTMPVGVFSSAHCMQLTPTRLAGEAVDQHPRPELQFFARGKRIHHLRVIAAPAGVPPFHHQKHEAERDRAAEDALIAGRAGVGMFVRPRARRA